MVVCMNIDIATQINIDVNMVIGTRRSINVNIRVRIVIFISA